MSEEAVESPTEETSATAPPGPADATETTESESQPGDGAWRDSIDDEGVRKLADRYNSPADMARAHAELNRELSQRIKVPGTDATDEDVLKFRKALGVPETADGYEIARPEIVSEEAFEAETTKLQLT